MIALQNVQEGIFPVFTVGVIVGVLVTIALFSMIYLIDKTNKK